MVHPTRYKWPKSFKWTVSYVALKEGQMLPRGYGVAWQDYHRLTFICLPVPFNVLARWGRDVWFWLRHFGVSRDRYDQAFKTGYDKGVEAGRRSERVLLESDFQGRIDAAVKASQAPTDAAWKRLER